MYAAAKARYKAIALLSPLYCHLIISLFLTVISCIENITIHSDNIALDTVLSLRRLA